MRKFSHHSEEAIRKMSETKKGKHLSPSTEFKKGMTPWNTGKKHSRETRLKISLAHLGIKRPEFTEETKKKMSKAQSGKNNYWYGKMPSNLDQGGRKKPFGNIKQGWHIIGGKRLFLRSNWEANYAKYLEWLKEKKEIQNWEYEADVFFFEKIKSGTTSYRPDFKIFNKNGSVEYHEIKGWMTPRSKTQLKRMKKYHPNIKLVLVDQKAYTDIKNKLGGIVGFS